MRFSRTFALLGLLMAFLMAIPVAAASPDESHVWFINRTTDGWAFVTEFHYVDCRNVTIPGTIPGGTVECGGKKKTADHSWCVAPGAQVRRGFPFYVSEVRVEVTMTTNCRQPIVFDKRLPFTRNGAISINQFELDGHDGRYTYTSRHT